MNLELKDQVAVVVGGASGIGLAIATSLAKEGAKVAILDRSPQGASEASRLAAEHGVMTTGIEVDATQFSTVKQAIAEVASQLGAIEHVVYAAGMGSGKFGFPFWNLDPADWPRVFEVNLMGAVNTAHACASILAEQKRGTMLFISSVAGQIGSPTDPPYSTAKAALISFAQIAAKDFAPLGVRVNTICPGMVQTPLNRSVWQSWNDLQPDDKKRSYEDWAGEKVKNVIPLKRWQTPDDVASLAVFLASARAANITGQTMNVDGGWVMHW